MKLKTFITVLLTVLAIATSSALAQQINPNQIRPGQNGQFMTTNNNQANWTSAISPFQLDFYVAGTPSTCAGGTTALDCAVIAAQAYATANNVQPIIHLAPGINTTCNTVATSAQHRFSILGNGMVASTIQQICSVSTPVVSYGCNTGTSDAEAIHLERFRVDANNLAPQGLVFYAQNTSFLEHLNVIGANGPNNFVQIGNTSCPGGQVGSAFQISLNDLYVDGKGTGPSSWATGTVSISGGTPSVSISNGGTYNHQHPPGYLTGYGSGPYPCTTMGSVTVNTAASGSHFTVTGVTLSGFSGCTAGVGAYIFIPDMPPAQYGVDFQFFTDSVATMVVTNGVGQTASIHNENSANTFVEAHPYNSYTGIKDDAGGNWYGVDCDSNQIMFDLNATTRVHGCNAFYNDSSHFPGATLFLLRNLSNGSTIEGTNVITASENADYHEFVTTAGGPVDTGQGDWPSNSIDLGSPTAAPNNIAGRHDRTYNQVDDYVGFNQYATALANGLAFSRKWTQSVWNGTAHVEESWSMEPLTPASGIPTQDFFHVTPPSNEVAASPSGNVGWLFDPLFTATVSNNSDSQLIGIRGSYYDGTAPVTAGWNFQSKFGTGTTPTNTLFITPTACPSGAGTCVLSTNAQLDAPTLTLAPTISQPTCAAAIEGMLWYHKGSGSSPGSLQICQNQSGTFTWVTH
jgi:hypothetical protein